MSRRSKLVIALTPQEGRDFQMILLDAADLHGATAVLIEARLRRRGRAADGGTLGVFGVRGRGLRLRRVLALRLRLRLRLRGERLYRVLLAA